ncbi:MAG: hypothetical protein ACLP0J_06075, partial [Solirubrobacteraceae bacterium]
MRLSEDLPLDPVVLAELEAIDATLRGEAVDPDHAELAELALFLAAERPQMPAAAAQSLDMAVARRFAPVVAGPRAGAGAHAGDDPHVRAGADAGRGRGGGSSTSLGPRVGGWARRPAFGLGLACVAAVAVAGVLVLSPGPTGSYSSDSTASSSTSSSSAGSVASTTSGSHAAPQLAAPAPRPPAPAAPASGAATTPTDQSEPLVPTGG